MGNVLLLLAACLCGVCVVLSFLQAHSNLIKKITLVLWSLSTALSLSATALMVAFQILSRFEYRYVYSHTSKDISLIYKISSLWSGQEGSFLLWALILGIMGFFVLRMKGKGANRAFGIYTTISFCIFMMCLIVQPFAKAALVPSDGLGLSAALKDPWMVVHPPLVFISYSAMAVLFSLSATLSQNANNEVAGRILIWLRISWVFLGIGILSGSIWAYRALGWGEYWAWDPIENAALVPWLILCGYLHCKELSNRLVCMVPFPIACFGVFLARSGVLKDQSAHAYANGNVIITGIILCFILGTALFFAFSVIRKKTIQNNRRLSIHDKRLVNYSINGYAALIFIGTVAPIIINIKTPITYYTAISIAFSLTYSVLLLIQDLESLKRRNILMIAVSTVLVIGIVALSGSDRLWWLLSLWICLMPPCLWVVSGFHTKSPKYYLSHLGVVLLIVGAIGSSALCKEAFVLSRPDSNHVVIADTEIPIAKLAEKDVLIISLPMKDLVIECSKITLLPQGGILIPYETKPLILLFWIGGFAILAEPCIFIISGRLAKRKKWKQPRKATKGKTYKKITIFPGLRKCMTGFGFYSRSITFLILKKSRTIATQ